jgi:hypothetical protein
MRSHQISQSSVSTVDSKKDKSDLSSYGQYGQADGADQDVMCLVYPDGRVMTVAPKPKAS